MYVPSHFSKKDVLLHNKTLSIRQRPAWRTGDAIPTSSLSPPQPLTSSREKDRPYVPRRGRGEPTRGPDPGGCMRTRHGFRGTYIDATGTRSGERRPTSPVLFIVPEGCRRVWCTCVTNHYRRSLAHTHTHRTAYSPFLACFSLPWECRRVMPTLRAACWLGRRASLTSLRSRVRMRAG